MKLINNKSLRELEEQENRSKDPRVILREKIEEQRRKEQEKQELTLTILCDWRILGQINPITKAVWNLDAAKNRNDFLQYAISHRNELEEVIVEPFDIVITNRGSNCIEVEYDKDTIDELCREANRLGLSKLEYVKAILYTTALKINQKRQAEHERNEAARIEATPLWIGSGFISQKLKRKLEAKYGKPSGYIIPSDVYTNMLVSLADEYFGLDQ